MRCNTFVLRLSAYSLQIHHHCHLKVTLTYLLQATGYRSIISKKKNKVKNWAKPGGKNPIRWSLMSSLSEVKSWGGVKNNKKGAIR